STGHMGDGSELTCQHSKRCSIPLQRFAMFLSLLRQRHDYASGGTSGGVGRTAGVGGNGGTSGLAGCVASCTAFGNDFTSLVKERHRINRPVTALPWLQATLLKAFSKQISVYAWSQPRGL
ncbi:MAG: hypothetical protein ACK5RF_01880, partial [Pirellula sp.]